MHAELRSGNGQVGLIPALRGATFSWTCGAVLLPTGTVSA